MRRAQKPHRGKSLQSLIENLVQQVRVSEAPQNERDRACAMLQSISGEWRVTSPQFPAPPGRPAFNFREGVGKCRTKISVPPDRRAAYNGQTQTTCYWPGEGYEAYARYLAEIDERVAAVQGEVEPRKEPLPAALDLSAVEVDTDLIESLKGRTEANIGTLAQVIFRSPYMTEKTPRRLQNLKSHWKKVLGFLATENRLRIDQITDTVLENFRAWCVQQLASGHHKRVYLNDFLSVFRDILGRLRGKFQMTCLPASYEDDLRDITEREADRIGKNAGHPKGNVSFGTTEMIAYPPEFVGSLLRLAEPSALDHLILLLSLNLAAGAKDLNTLTWWDRSKANPVLRVDMEKKRFVNILREKSYVPSYVYYDGSTAVIPMMERTYEALVRWKKQVPFAIQRLRNRMELRENAKLVAKARQLRAAGLDDPQIGQELGIPIRRVHTILEQPADMGEFCRNLARDGYSGNQIVAVTGLSKATVSYHTKEVRKSIGKAPGVSLNLLQEPDDNLVLFHPETGRQLTDYIEDMFEQLVVKSGVIREEDIASGKVKRPPPGTFVLPKLNRHYGLRRTAATVCGMVGGVIVPVLQTFMGHKTPQMTFKYVKMGEGYTGKRVDHNYQFVLEQRPNDPIGVISDFIDLCLTGEKKRSRSRSRRASA